MASARRSGVALLGEVAAVLAAHGRLKCTPSVKEDDGLFTVSVTLHPPTPDEAMEGLEVFNELSYLAGLAQVRLFATDYGIDAAALEALLPKERT